MVSKDEAIESMKSKSTLLEQKCSDMRAFIIRNCTPELKELFKNSGLYQILNFISILSNIHKLKN